MGSFFYKPDARSSPRNLVPISFFNQSPYFYKEETLEKMFKNTFQSGFLSILYSLGSKPLQIWDKEVVNGHVKRPHDDDIQSNVLEIIGSNIQSTYITCPADPAATLGIKLPFLVMIVKNLKKYFTFEIQILDDKNVRRRFRASNFQAVTRVKPYICTMPLRLDEGWNQIQLNLADYTRRAYGTNYVETLRVQVHANCCLRRIYFSDRLYSEEELPPEFKLYLPMQATRLILNDPTNSARTHAYVVIHRVDLDVVMFLLPYAKTSHSLQSFPVKNDGSNPHQENIASQMVGEAVSLARVGEQVEWIQGELRRMLCFLKDADSKQDGDARVRNWVADIREVAYDTEDAIDSYILKMMQRKEKHLIISFFNRYPFCFNELIARYKLNKQINRIKMKIHDISCSRSTYGIENIGKGGEGASFAVNISLRERRRSFPHSSEEEIVVGTEEDIKILEDQLVNGESRLSIISIIGMAGIGKTTLAKKIFFSSNVNHYFDSCAWIYVSQEYKDGDLLRDLCKKVMGLRKEDLEKMYREEMEEELSSFLEQKRYIVVFDDIWNKEVWGDLKTVFPDTKNGSRIVFTTRFRDVALHADPRTRPHELCLLSDEDSWKLLSKKICLEWNAMTSLPAWAEELGKQIVKKSRGLPLAIVVLGGLLSRREANFEEWLKVLQSAHWQLLQDPAQCIDILALSFHDLPCYLKPCFLYFGLFPEDFEISAKRLILLWVAEGFVKPRGQEPLDDVAEDYLVELVGRSMVQIAAKKLNGKIKTIRIHDLLRELAIKKAKEDRFFDIIHGDVKDCFLTKPRRLSTSFGVTPKTRNSSRIRSLLVFDHNEPRLKDLKNLKLLRVLDLESVHIGLLDSDVGNFIHLRYLGLKGTWLKRLPSSICNLLNLQTLDLRSTLVEPIPVFIW
ncbi:hypothetical protein REPUB_Repub08aG0048900 [Reevesia pubescens]